MNPDIKEEWCSLLEHGDLKQIKGNLISINENGFCCLGVLCELAEEYGLVKLNDLGIAYQSLEDTSDRSALSLPNVVRKWAGLDFGDPIPQGSLDSLSVLNDDKDKTFPEIAKIIREGL